MALASNFSDLFNRWPKTWRISRLSFEGGEAISHSGPSTAGSPPWVGRWWGAGLGGVLARTAHARLQRSGARDRAPLGGRTRRTPSRARAARLRSHRRGVGAPALAAKHATSTIPIVIAASNDPVGAGLFASLAHPGGNVTGLSCMQEDIAGKELELLKVAFPSVERVAVLVKPRQTRPTPACWRPCNERPEQCAQSSYRSRSALPTRAISIVSAMMVRHGWRGDLRQTRRGRLVADLSGYGEPDTV
jgi:ABC transporter substrate binding protein